jgi:hypothetical protein
MKNLCVAWCKWSLRVTRLALVALVMLASLLMLAAFIWPSELVASEAAQTQQRALCFAEECWDVTKDVLVYVCILALFCMTAGCAPAKKAEGAVAPKRVLEKAVGVR